MKGLWWKIALPVVAVLAALSVGAYFLFFSGASVAKTINNSFTIMHGEIVARIDNSPLKAAAMLKEAVKDGKMTVGFDYEDSWYEVNYKGNASIVSNIEERNFELAGALTLDYGYYKQDLNAELFINKERIAVGTRMLDNNYYGITYDTFERDIRKFTGLLGIDDDDETIDMLIQSVDMLNQAMNAKTEEIDENSPDIKKYIDLYNNFADSIELNSEKVKIESGGVSVNCTKIDFVVSDDALFTFLDDYYEALQNDDLIREQYEQGIGAYYESLFTLIPDAEYMFDSMDDFSYDGILKQIKTALKEFKSNFKGEIAVTLYIGKGDRMLRIEVDADISYDGERVNIDMTMDFGESINDRWRLEINVDADSERNTAVIDWRYNERASGTENRITVTADKEELLTLSSIWNSQNGDFTLSATTEWDEMEISGNFMWDDTGFDLEIDDIFPDPDESLVLTLKVDYGASAKSIDFINLDKWDGDLISKIEDMAYSMFY